MSCPLVVAMPAWNEADGIGEFIWELNESLKSWQPRFIVVDDCSSDTTVTVVNALKSKGINLEIVRNSSNLGHGPSTYLALELALTLEPEIVVAVDGDGQFLGPDLARVTETSLESGFDVVEGVRSNRHEPWFRRSVTSLTRYLIWSRSRHLPRDANTPLRAYRARFLAEILVRIPRDSPIPNLHISALSRKQAATIYELPVQSRPRRGSQVQGTTWGKRQGALPSRRFVAFCARAAREWVQVRV